MPTLRTAAVLFLVCVAGASASCRHESPSFSADAPGPPALAAPPQRSPGAAREIPVEQLRIPRLVGRVFGDAIPFPGSARRLGGWTIDPSVAAPTMGVEERSIGKRRVLVLDSMIRTSRTGQPTWLIVDAIRLPDVGDSLELDTYCGYGRAEEDRRLIALVKPVDAYEMADIRAAWRVNRTAQRFEAASLADLRCWNEGWGQ
jgi:hypothetical protein